MINEKILIVEDQFIEANNLQMILERAGYSVCGIARSVHLAEMMIAKSKPDMVMLDIFLQGAGTGIDLARKLREQHIPFLYLSANSDAAVLEAAKATRPYGFLVKPFREKDVLVMLEIARYLHVNSLENVVKKNMDAGNSVVHNGRNFFGIIGQNKKLLEVIAHLQLVAPTDTSVLILGETGTGKERVAECLHELSQRNGRPLIKVNCAALPSTLIESVLFGHERGAFTGATERRIGKFEQAHRGTLFLDEVGEMPGDVQSRLLRALQEKEIERVGGSSVIKVDVRVIAATNRVLEKEVAAGRFRMDLYYRLNVFPLMLPPLRERADDIPLLAKHFIEYYCRKLGKPALEITDAVLKTLFLHAWPGNIRELEHTIERAVLVAQGKIKQVEIADAFSSQQADNRIKTMEETEKDHIIAVLKKCDGKIFGKGGAAELLGLNPSTLNSRIKKLGIIKTNIIT